MLEGGRKQETLKAHKSVSAASLLCTATIFKILTWNERKYQF